MKTQIKTITINGVEYVEKDAFKDAAPEFDGMKYVLVRGDRSGVFVGYLESQIDRSVVLRQCRRIWYWDGAASISQIAIDGVSKPENCKFPEALNRINVLDSIEVIEVTAKAKKSIEDVKPWKM